MATDGSAVAPPVCTQGNNNAGDGAFRCYVETGTRSSQGIFGEAGEFLIAKPFVAKFENAHSNGQLSVATADSPNAGRVEVGWTVSTSLEDLQPRLFVSWSTNNFGTYCINNGENGQIAGTNKCMLGIAGTRLKPGVQLVPGETHSFAIRHFTNGISEENDTPGWYIFSDNQAFGYYPDSYWSGSFTQAEQVQWFGEVASNVAAPTTAMGTGSFGYESTAASISSMEYYTSSDPAAAPTAWAPTTNPPVVYPPNSLYTLGNFFPGVSSFTYGGPGAAAKSAYMTSLPLPLPSFEPPSIGLQQVGSAGAATASPSGIQAFPGPISVAPDGSRVYVESINPAGLWAFNTVADSGALSPPAFVAGNVTSSNLDTRAAGMSVSPDGKALWMTTGENCLYGFYTTSLRFSGCIAVGPQATSSGPVSITSDEKSLFVATSNGVYKSNYGQNFHLIGQTPLNSNAMAISPDQSHLYITSTGSDMYIVDLAALSNITPENYSPKSVVVGASQQIGVAVSPDSRIVYVLTSNNSPFPFIPNYGITSNTQSSIVMFDASGFERNSNANLTPIAPTILLPDGYLPVGISISADGSTLYVATSCWLVSHCPSQNAEVIRIARNGSKYTVGGPVPLTGAAPQGNDVDHITGSYFVPVGNFAGGR